MSKNSVPNPPADPWTLFKEGYRLAEKSEPSDANAMALATVGLHGVPSVRMVLFKGHGPEGLMFLTNRESHKGEQLRRHPHAAICLHWKSIQRQVRAEGPITP